MTLTGPQRAIFLTGLLVGLLGRVLVDPPLGLWLSIVGSAMVLLVVVVAFATRKRNSS